LPAHSDKEVYSAISEDKVTKIMQTVAAREDD